MPRLALKIISLATPSILALSANAATFQNRPFLTCKETKSTAAQVQVEVSNPYNDNYITRVTVRETGKDGNRTVTLHDLITANLEGPGKFANLMFRMTVSPVVNPNSGLQAAHIDFLYDSGVRASANLTCKTLGL